MQADIRKWLTPEERAEHDAARRVVRAARKEARDHANDVRLLRARARKRRDDGKPPYAAN